MSGLDSSDEEELNLMRHLQKGEHTWVYTGCDEMFGTIFERYQCCTPGCPFRDYRPID